MTKWIDPKTRQNRSKPSIDFAEINLPFKASLRQSRKGKAFEPTTNRLTAKCSTAELKLRFGKAERFEPTTNRLTAECSTAELKLRFGKAEKAKPLRSKRDPRQTRAK